MDLSLLTPGFFYPALLNVGVNGEPGTGVPGLSNTLLTVTDGNGNLSPFSISKLAVNFTRDASHLGFQLDGIDLTVSATVLNNLSTATLNVLPTANQIDVITVDQNTKRIALSSNILNVDTITLNTNGYIKLQNNGHFSGWKASTIGIADGIYQLPGFHNVGVGKCLISQGEDIDGTFTTTWGIPSIQEVSVSVDQVAHGFAKGDILKPNGLGGYEKAQANNATNGMGVVGYVSLVIDADTFVLGLGGMQTSTFTSPVLTPGGTYWLSDTTSGAYTSTPPVTGSGKVQKVLFMAITTTKTIWLNHRGNVIP